MKTFCITGRALGLFAVAAVVFASVFTSCYDDSGILERLDKLEGTAIKNIEQQIAAINASVTALQEIDRGTERALADLSSLISQHTTAIEDLRAYDGEMTDSIRSLKQQLADELELCEARYSLLAAYAEALSEDIGHLQVYVNSMSVATADWVTGTFSTLAQHDSIVAALTGVRQTIATLDHELTALIDSSILSVRSWVNETLDGYYDISAADAKMEWLRAEMSAYTDSVTSLECAGLKVELDSARSQLTAGYRKAIAEAIETNNGVIDGKIAEEVSALNARIDREVQELGNRISTLEGRVEALENEVNALKDEVANYPKIIFEVDDVIAYYPGDLLEVKFSLLNCDADTKVEAMASGWWNAEILMSSTTEGKVIVTVPAQGGNGKVLVFVNRRGSTVMGTLLFEEGELTVAQETFSVAGSGGTVTIPVSTNLMNYKVSIPESMSWISLSSVSTKATLREDIICLEISSNDAIYEREGLLRITNGADSVITTVYILQEALPVPSNEVWYTTTDGNAVEMQCAISSQDISCVSHQKEGDKYVIRLTKDITILGANKAMSWAEGTFNRSNIQCLRMPNTVTEISGGLCNFCEKLQHVWFSDSLTKIGGGAFESCYALEEIVFPKTMKYAGDLCFSACMNTKPIVIPEGMTWGARTFGLCNMADFTVPADFPIAQWTFEGWHGNITISEGVSKIPMEAFSGATFETIHIPGSVLAIEYGAFNNCQQLTEVSWSDGALTLGHSAFFCCLKLEEITLPASLIQIGTDAFDGTPLKTVHFAGDIPPSIEQMRGVFPEPDERDLFPTDNEGFKVMVPFAAVSTYKTQWPLIADYIFGE